METLIRRLMDVNIRGWRNRNNYLSHSVRRAQLPNILLVVVTNKAVGVLEERLQNVLPVFHDRTKRCMTVVPIQLLLGSEQENLFRACLRATTDNIITQSVQQQFPKGIKLCTLGSVYRAYPS